MERVNSEGRRLLPVGQGTKVEEKLLKEYAGRIKDIVRRSEAIVAIFDCLGASIPAIVVTEIVYLQLRHMLELLARALLAVNEGVVSKEGAQRQAPDILDHIKAANADFYPIPRHKRSSQPDGVIPIPERKDDFLTHEKFVTLYNECNQILHAHLPKSGAKDRFSSVEECKQRLEAAGRWNDRIARLLTHHEFRVRGDPTLYIAHTVGKDLDVQVAEFKMIGFLPISKVESAKAR